MTSKIIKELGVERMIHLVTGGSGSGKSEYAENWLTGRNKKDGTYIYIATMQPYTEETMKKD